MRFLFKILLYIVSEVVYPLLVIFIKGADHSVIDELAVVEVIVDQHYVDEKIEDYVQIAILIWKYSARTEE